MPYLTPEKVTEVRELLASGLSTVAVSRQAKCSEWSVRQIRLGNYKPRYRNLKRYATQDDWKRRLPPTERDKANGKPWRCSCGLLVKGRVCVRCEVVGVA